jgi:hypothetical protein
LTHLYVPLVKKSRALYWSANKEIRAAVTISKQYADAKGRIYFWFAYHPDWDEFLGDAVSGLYVLGCVGRDEAYVLPYEWIHSRMKNLKSTLGTGKSHWHIFLYPTDAGGLALWLDGGKLEPLDKFRVGLPLSISTSLKA